DASVAAGADGEEFESFWIEAQSERGGESLGKLHGGFLPAWLGGVEFVVDGDFGDFAEGLVEGAAFVDFVGAEEEADSLAEAFGEEFEEGFEGFLDGGGAAGDGVSEEVGIFEPDEFFAAEEGEGEEGVDGLADTRDGVFGIGGVAIDEVAGEIAGVGRGELICECFGGAFDFGFVGTEDGVDGGGDLAFGGGHRWEAKEKRGKPATFILRESSRGRIPAMCGSRERPAENVLAGEQKVCVAFTVEGEFALWPPELSQFLGGDPIGVGGHLSHLALVRHSFASEDCQREGIGVVVSVFGDFGFRVRGPRRGGVRPATCNPDRPRRLRRGKRDGRPL
ncbi:MAG: hypothetical protein RLZZ399_2889, partial [Verrucomicrobiota bacterium]